MTSRGTSRIDGAQPPFRWKRGAQAGRAIYDIFEFGGTVEGIKFARGSKSSAASEASLGQPKE